MGDTPLVSNNLPDAKLEDVRHEGNSYLTKKGEPLLLHGEKRYSSVHDWRRATGQETREGKPTVGTAEADSLKIPADYRLTDPRALAEWPLFKATIK